MAASCPMDFYFKFATSLVQNNTALLLIIIVILANLICLRYIYVRFIKLSPRVLEMIDKHNGPARYPIIGNALEVLVPNHKIIKLNIDYVKKYGRIIRGSAGSFIYFFAGDAKTVEKVLSSNVHIEKSWDYELLHPWLNSGLLTANGRKWHGRRKLLTPTFHFKILEDFIDIFNEQSDILVRILAAGTRNAIDIFPYLSKCTLDVICESAMGEKLRAQTNSDSDYVHAVHRLGEMIVFRFVRPWFRLKFIWNLMHGREEKKLLNIVHGFTESVIRKQKAEIKAKATSKAETVDTTHIQGKRRLAFLDLLLEVSDEGKVLTDSDVREETDTFMFEGQDTTSASLSWTTFLLACNQKCQDLVRKELFEIFGNDRNRRIVSSDFPRMKYLEYCIKESLRLYPSVPYFSRELKSDLDLGDRKAFPSGSTIFITTYTLHRDPSVFNDPEKFCPERFEPKNCIGRNPYAYVPFSAGPRNCIGQKFALMEEKVVLAKLFLNFKVEAAERLEDVVVVPDVILRPKNGLHVKLTPI